MTVTDRATDTIDITINHQTAARENWGVWAAKEQALASELERTPLNASKEREKLQAGIDTAQANQAAQLETIKTGMVTLTVRALSRGEYRNLMKNHAPRPDDETDKALGYNADTFAAALLRLATISAKTLTGQVIPLQLDTWLDEEQGVDAAEFEAWFTTALALNKPRASSFPPLRVS